MRDKKTAYTDSELLSICKRDGIEEKYFPRFLTYYKYCFDELYEDHKDINSDDFDEDESLQERALCLTNSFIKKYLAELTKGHGEEWAFETANSVEEEEIAVYLVYTKLKANNPELAYKELITHTKSLGGDEYFERYYLYLFEVVADPLGRIKAAKNYSRLYREKLAKGKTEIYAHHYAKKIVDGEYDELYCEEYAFAYDKAKSDNKSDEYADIYADKYGEALINIKNRFGIYDDEEMIVWAIEKVNAYMSAWEYGKKNNLKDFNRFAKIYENVYLNTKFPDEDKLYPRIEEIEKHILEKVLEQYNKIRN